MTLTMDNHKIANKKRGSWDSKVSISTVSTTTRPYSRRHRAPSSILSSDSDIRFTRKKLSSSVRCGCYILAGFLTFLLFAAIFVYIAYTYVLSDDLTEKSFRGTFRVIEGDTFLPELADPSTELFRVHSREYREKINLLFRRSELRPGFDGTEILAFDGEDGKDLIVHFNLHFDPHQLNVDEFAIMSVLLDEINLRDNARFLTNITIDPSTLDVQKSDAPITTPATLRATSTELPSTTIEITPPRKCHPIELQYCKHLPYNLTSYPNVLGHTSVKEIEDDVIAFRELVDAECYHMAYEFVCQLLQPSCSVRINKFEDEMIMPCRSFCRDFITGCGSRLPERIKTFLDCSRFPEFGGIGTCRPKPGCIQELKSKAMSPRICDGIIDCEDLSDETACAYCPAGYLHCGIGRKCIRPANRCDGKQDCPDNSDERNCLSLAPTIFNITQYDPISPQQTKYFDSGYVIYNEKGTYGKLCTENVKKIVENDTYILDRNPVLESVATSLCKSISYEKLESIQIKRDSEENIPYVQMKDPNASELTFVRAVCPNKEVLHVQCSELDCGVQALRDQAGIEGLSKMARHGDWPWHIALFKEDIHVCDGTLISSDWIITTASCFQGQPKAEWIAKAGQIRTDASAPWQQTRRIVGMVKSPVEGSTIVMVKLEEPYIFSDFIRPICLPEEHFVKGNILSNLSYCNTLGWARNREQLQRVQIQVTNMEKCENVSIATVNSICTESPYSTKDCNEEEFAGSPILCLLPDQKRWSLIGISNWRIACSKNGVERPRMYDKITSNIEWIQKTISAIT